MPTISSFRLIKILDAIDEAIALNPMAHAPMNARIAQNLRELERVRAWLVETREPVGCPICGAPDGEVCRNVNAAGRCPQESLS